MIIQFSLTICILLPDIINLMKALQAVPASSDGHEDHGNEDSHAGHDHKRKRRSIIYSDVTHSRVKRQAATTDTV